MCFSKRASEICSAISHALEMWIHLYRIGKWKNNFGKRWTSHRFIHHSSQHINICTTKSRQENVKYNHTAEDTKLRSTRPTTQPTHSAQSPTNFALVWPMFNAQFSTKTVYFYHIYQSAGSTLPYTSCHQRTYFALHISVTNLRPDLLGFGQWMKWSSLIYIYISSCSQHGTLFCRFAFCLNMRISYSIGVGRGLRKNSVI